MKNTFLKIGALALVAAAFSSCMKDKEFDNGSRGVNFDASLQNVVSLQVSSTDTANFQLTSFDANPNNSQFQLAAVSLAGGVTAPQDIHVVLALDTNLVNDYNTANGESFLNPASSTYSTSTLNVTIPAGQTKGYIYLNLIPANFLGATYAIGIRIVSVDGGYQLGAGYRTHGVFAFGIKNQYDGVYHILSGLVTRYTAPGVPANDALSGPLAGNPDVYLITTGQYSVTAPAPGGTGALPWAFGSNSQVAGINPLSIVVDPTTNQVTTTSGGNATLTNWAGHDNYYDPATKTFHLAWRWNPTANVREYQVVMQYVGPRP